MSVEGVHHRSPREEVVHGPSDRSFGFTFAAVFAAVAAITMWRGGGTASYVWLLLSGLFSLAALLRPGILEPLNKVWLHVGLLLHRFINPIVMALIFFFVFTPTGVIMRTFGKDFLRLSRKPGAPSYWITREPAHTSTDLRQQF
jgi:hypothetical protein